MEEATTNTTVENALAPADVLPRKQRTQPSIYVLYTNPNGFLEFKTCAGKKEAGVFIETMGAMNIVKVLKVSEEIEIKHKVIL